MDESYYDVAQVCENGHVVNDSVRDIPERNAPFCSRCGSKTITACPTCNTLIRGHYNVPGVIGFSPKYRAPAHCYHCGAPFPWTTAALQAAGELADLLEGLKPDRREELKKTLADLVRETPRSRVAETKFKAIMRTAGKEGYEAMKSALTEILSETVRKTLFGG
jgi:hypothetical protein